MVFVSVCAWQLRRRRAPLATAALLALAMYLLYGMFWFPTHLVDPLVWSLVGLGLVGTGAAAPRQKTQATLERGRRLRSRASTFELSRFVIQTAFLKANSIIRDR